jgi:D-serine deaminase-like pyridoxal phosphate-dependent protein
MPDVTRLDDLPTPALVLDLDVLEANLERMQAKADRLGVALRPHAKTHKCLEVADRQVALGARGLTVSTLAEARFFAASGFADLTWAFPLVLSRLEEARQLVERFLMMDAELVLRLTVDSAEAVEALAAQPTPFHVLLEVDCGYGRTGVDAASGRALELARRLADVPHLHFDGILSHSGNAYAAGSRGQARAVAEEERRAMAELAGRLREAGVEGQAPAPGEPPRLEVSVGSTPGMAAVEDLTGATEARPGNYCFYDGTQAALGSCTPADCAVTVLVSVVSCQPGAGHAVTDAGALALSKDPGPVHLGERWRWGMGAVFTDLATYRAGEPEPDLHLASLSQEHGKTSGATVAGRRLRVGERLRVLPNHSCLAIPNFASYWVVKGEDVVGRWGIFQGRE